MLYLLVLLCVAYLVYVWKNRYIFQLSWKLPGPISWPIIGNALMFYCKDEDLLERIENVLSLYPSPMRIWIGPKFVMIYTDLNQVEKVMNSSKFAHKDKQLYRFQEPFIGKGLITGSGPLYRADRKLISPMLGGKNSEGYMHIFQEQAEILINSLKETVDKPKFDIDLKVNQCAHNIVAGTLAGYNPQAENSTMDIFLKTVHSVYVLVHSRVLKVWLQVDVIFNLTSIGKYHKKSVDIIHSVVRKWLEFSRSNFNNNPIDTDNTISLEYEHRSEPIIHKLLKQNNFQTEEDFIYQITTVYVAGADTITAISSFALVMLGMHKDCQQKVHDELNSVFGRSFRKVELADIGELTYLDRCIKETLRLFPIAAFIMRQAVEDVQLDEYFIPKDCGVAVGIHFIHRNGKHWKKPNEFYPDHFLPEAVKERHPYAFIPFSVGLRGCIGKAYAYLALKTILATVLQKYEIEADGTMANFKIKTDISIRPKDGYMLRIRNRSNRSSA